MTPRTMPRARPGLGELAPYSAPGGPARVRLNTNESPHPPPQDVVDEIVAAVQGSALNRYPDRDATELRRRLADFIGLDPSQIWIANGSNEVLLHLMLAYGGAGRTALVFEPTYSLHSIVARIAGTGVEAGERNDDFLIDVDAAMDVTRRIQPDVMMLCSPNNPSGRSEPLVSTEALAEQDVGLVVVDEAYGEFAGTEASAFRLLDQHPNLVVVRTFSKAWSLAGIRLGYAVADANVIEDLRRVGLPYHLSVVAQVAGTAILRHAAALSDSVASIVSERDRLIEGLRGLDVMTVGSDANFVLFRAGDAARVWQGLLDRGVLVRHYLGDPRLNDFLRVTAGLPEETDSFIAALEEVLDE